MDDIYITLEKVGNSWGRKLIVPEEFSIAGVEHDKNARCFRFRIPKLPEFSDMVDLSGLSCRVNYQHEYYDYAFQTDLMVEQGTPDDDYMVFRWVLGAECFPKAGTLSFILCCSLTGEDGIVKEWNSEIATVTVQKGLERDTQIIDQPDASTTGWATTARIADGAVTLEKLAEDVKDEFAGLDEKITGAKEKAAQDDATLKKNIRDEYLNGIRYIGERFHGPCSRSGIEVMHITGKTTQERTNGYQLFDISKIPAGNPAGGKLYINPDESYSAFGTTTSANSVNYYYSVEETAKLLKSGLLSFVPKSDLQPYAFTKWRSNGSGSAGEINNRYTPSKEIRGTELGTEEMRIGIGWNNGVTLTARSEKPMLYQDGDGTWEPFTGGKPGPNPDYPLPLKSFSADKVVCMGKNVAVVSDIAKRENCTFNQLMDGTSVVKSTKGGSLYVGENYQPGDTYQDIFNVLIKIPEGADRIYHRSFDGQIKRLIISFWDKFKHCVHVSDTGSSNSANERPIPDDAYYVSLKIGTLNSTAGQTYTDRVMVSFEPITEWVPPHYEEITLPEPLILRGLPDGTADEYMGDGMIVRHVRKIKYSNTNNIGDVTRSFPAGISGGKNVFATSDTGSVEYLNWTDGDTPRMWCNYFVPIAIAKSVNSKTPENGISCSKTSGKIFFVTDDISSLDDFGVKLANEPMEILIHLAVPVIETYSMPILPSWDDDVRAFFVSETETEIEWRPCPIGDRSKDVQELKAAIEALN